MTDDTSRKIGLALGGGGARGLAHIPMLRTLEAAGLKPDLISATSIGAIIGVLYAAGFDAEQIDDGISELVAMPRSFEEFLEARNLGAWLDFIGIDIGRNSLLHVDRFLDELEDRLGIGNFEDLAIPLKVVAADFWAREEVVFDSGAIIPAVAASFALPGIFKPVVRDGRVLVDGGSVNPLPYDLLYPECDFTIAIDVLGRRTPQGDDLLPSYSETVFNTFQIAEKAILNEKFKRQRPDIYIEVDVANVKVLEFHRYEEIYEQAEPARAQLEAALAEQIESGRLVPA